MAPSPTIDRTRATSPPPLTFARWFVGVLERWRLFLVAAFVAAGGIVALALLSTPSYRGEASFVSNTDAGVKLPGALGGIAGLAGMASQAGVSLGGEPSESPAFYTQLIQSRELLTRVLESRFADFRTDAPSDSARLVDMLKLRGNTPARRLERGVEHLTDVISFTGDPRTNLVSVTVDMPASDLAAGVANRIVALVSEFNKEQRISRAHQRRVFLEKRLRDAEGDLRAAEDRQRDFLLANRNLRSPTLAADAQRLQRRVDQAEGLARGLRQEYETATIDEVNDAPVITSVDSAVAPQRPRWPRPVPLAALALASGLVVGLLTTGAATLYADWARRHPADAQALRRAVRFRRAPDPLPAPVGPGDRVGATGRADTNVEAIG